MEAPGGKLSLTSSRSSATSPASIRRSDRSWRRAIHGRRRPARAGRLSADQIGIPPPWGSSPREPALGSLARPMPKGSDWTVGGTHSGRYGIDDQPNVSSSNRRCQHLRLFQPLCCHLGIVDPVISPNRMASSRMRAAISQIFRSAPGPNFFRKERAAA